MAITAQECACVAGMSGSPYIQEMHRASRFNFMRRKNDK